MTHTQTKYTTVESMFSHSRSYWTLHTKSLDHGNRCTSELEMLRWFTSMRRRNITAVVTNRKGKIVYSFLSDQSLPRLDHDHEIGPMNRLEYHDVAILIS